MPIEVLMPALSPTMKEGNMAKWLKKEGDAIKSGDVIAEIETDKAVMEVEACDSGTIGKILVQENTQGVKVNTTIALILEKGEDVKSVEGFAPKLGFLHGQEKKIEEEKKPVQQTHNVEVQNKPNSSHSNSDRIFASPLAKRIAEQNNVNLSQIQGSGPHGRVVKKDVESYKPTNSFVRNNVEFVSQPASTMRKVIASRLTQSKQDVPHFYLFLECDADAICNGREAINNFAPKNKEGKPEYKISINDIITKSCAMAIKKHPNINSSWNGDEILRYNNIDISIAVAIPDGLITPIVKNADHKSLLAISNEVKDLAKRAKEGKLAPSEFQGGSFSISNLGMYGIDHFNAIINPPQACILSVGGIIEKPVIKNGTVVPGKTITIGLSVDHRVIDGADAAMFLGTLKSIIENPILIGMS
jgi:pyruvate dehydrogenase E2 component (dihydrolipoamide acetyltransferase)